MQSLTNQSMCISIITRAIVLMVFNPLNFVASSLNKTNRPHVAVALYSYKSQRTSKHAKNTSDTLN